MTTSSAARTIFRLTARWPSRVIAVYPEAAKLAQANRRFLTRAVWYLAEHGITQYVDLGCGMPDLADRP